MTTIRLELDGAAAVIAAAQLRDDARRIERRDPLWGRQLHAVAQVIEDHLYETASNCVCRDPICPKVHPTDALVGLSS